MPLGASSGWALGFLVRTHSSHCHGLHPQSFWKLVTSMPSVILRSPLEVIMWSPYIHVEGN